MTDSLFIRNVLLDGAPCDIIIRNGIFASIAPHGAAAVPADIRRIIDGTGKAMLPAFYNTHTHNAMSLLRGYADDMPLGKWLGEWIWPAEARMTAEDMRAGVRLSMVEMIHSGTVFFNDMYFNWKLCQDLLPAMGMRAAVGDALMSHQSAEMHREAISFLKDRSKWADGVQYSVDPHAIYTCNENELRKFGETALETGCRLHIHLSETRQEVDDCLQQHGCTPVEWLDRLGLLGPHVIAAHCVHLTDHDIDLLAGNQVTLAHCPCSNMKLGSGIFPSDRVSRRGLRVTLGTDGPSSNNNVDMQEEMKTASLLAKVQFGAEALPATEVFRWATVNGAEAFGLNAGVIAEGKDADALLVNCRDTRFIPGHNLISDWVYSGDRACISMVLCQGRILMENGKVDGEDEIIDDAVRHTHDLLKRIGKN